MQGGERNDEGESLDNCNVNATDTIDSSVPGEVSLGGGSVASKSGRAGDAFAPSGASGGARNRGNGSQSDNLLF